MNDDRPSIASEAAWNDVVNRSIGRTVMVIGGPGTGKTRLSEYLVRQLAAETGTVALVCADMGQPSVGVPTCLGLALTEPRNRPAALWFIGDTSPRGNLLPTVVGTARLVQRAQAEGVQTVLIDTTGLVDGALGRVLKYHKALAAGVDQVVAIQRVSELEAILTLLDGVGPTIHRVGPSPRARDRGPDERKAYREARYQEHLHDGRVLRLDPRCLVAPDWKPGPCPGRQQPAIGTLVGLLDREGFCLGLGTIEQIQSDRLLVYTTWKDPETVALIQVGTVRLNRREGWSEIR